MNEQESVCFFFVRLLSLSKVQAVISYLKSTLEERTHREKMRMTEKEKERESERDIKTAHTELVSFYVVNIE